MIQQMAKWEHDGKFEYGLIIKFVKINYHSLFIAKKFGKLKLVVNSLTAHFSLLVFIRL